MSTTANNLFATAVTRTIVVSALPAGLYIMTFSLYIINASQTTASFTNMLFRLASSSGFDYFNENDYHPFTLAVAQNQTFSKMFIVNNPSLTLLFICKLMSVSLSKQYSVKSPKILPFCPTVYCLSKKELA